MSEVVDISREVTFSSPIDVTAVLDRLKIQFLDVHERRAIVIFAGSILNIECDDETLTELTRAEITVYDLPLNRDTNAGSETEAAIELIEDFTTQISGTEPIA